MLDLLANFAERYSSRKWWSLLLGLFFVTLIVQFEPFSVVKTEGWSPNQVMELVWLTFIFKIVSIGLVAILVTVYHIIVGRQDVCELHVTRTREASDAALKLSDASLEIARIEAEAATRAASSIASSAPSAEESVASLSPQASKSSPTETPKATKEVIEVSPEVTKILTSIADLTDKLEDELGIISDYSKSVFQRFAEAKDVITEDAATAKANVAN